MLHSIFQKQKRKTIGTASMAMLCASLFCAVLMACTPASGASDGIFSTKPTQNNPATADALRDVVTTLTYLPAPGAAEGGAQTKSDYALIDYTNASQGYAMVEYLGHHTGQVKLQLTGPNDITYTYTLAPDAGFKTYPLTAGDGEYTINIYEQDSGTSYYLVDSATFAATIKNALSPYLYPNCYVDYNQTSTALTLSIDAATNVSSELTLVSNIYQSVMDTLEYDYDLATLIASGGLSSYVPNLDAVIEKQSGICFDYASLMVAMLRMQGVPTKLVIGYAGEAYHAWINVYTVEEGWVEKVIYFEGGTWVLMDPTFGDTAGNNDYVGDGANYTEKYIY